MPNEPPAAVIIIMMAAESNDLPTHPVVESICKSNFFGSLKASTIPMSRATTGWPINPKSVLTTPVPKGLVGKSETDLNTISNSGTITGMKDLNADGALFYFFYYVLVALVGIRLYLETCGVFCDKVSAAIMAAILATMPVRITSPRSASIMPAAAMGPGVGGTKQCVRVSPSDRAMAVLARVILAFLESALLSGARITKPESA